jgi:hypothetical protein
MKLLAGIDISCGGPLDSRRGLVQTPPDPPGWDGIDLVAPFRAAFGGPTALPYYAPGGPVFDDQAVILERADQPLPLENRTTPPVVPLTWRWRARISAMLPARAGPSPVGAWVSTAMPASIRAWVEEISWPQ